MSFTDNEPCSHMELPAGMAKLVSTMKPSGEPSKSVKKPSDFSETGVAVFSIWYWKLSMSLNTVSWLFSAGFHTRGIVSRSMRDWALCVAMDVEMSSDAPVTVSPSGR